MSPDDCSTPEISPPAVALAVVTDGGSSSPQLALVPTIESDRTELGLEQRRRKAAKRIWDLHERLCVEAGFGLPAEGGGLREPSDEDVSAIRRCAKAIRKQERVTEERAWQILAEATRAIVDEAVRAREAGDPKAKDLCRWRRNAPFGGPRGTKLRPLLIARENWLRRRGVVNGHALTIEQAKAYAKRKGELPDGFAYDADNNVVRADEAVNGG